MAVGKMKRNNMYKVFIVLGSEWMLVTLSNIAISFTIVIVISIITSLNSQGRTVGRKAEVGGLHIQRPAWVGHDDASGWLELPWGGCSRSHTFYSCAENIKHTPWNRMCDAIWLQRAPLELQNKRFLNTQERLKIGYSYLEVSFLKHFV